MNRALWVVQGLLSALFLFGGASKLTMPLDEIAAMVGVSVSLIVFISVMEILGGLGLLLPGLLRIRTGLTPLAAAGLAIIMAGAVVIGIGMGDPVGIAIPLVVGLLAAFVAYGRWRVVPLRQRTSPVLQPAA